MCHCRLEDDERLDALLDQLEKKTPSQQQQQQQQAKKVPTGAAVTRGPGKRPAGRAAPGSAAGRRVGAGLRQPVRQSDQQRAQQEAEQRRQQQQQEEDGEEVEGVYAEEGVMDTGDVAGVEDSEQYGSADLGGEESGVSSSISAPSSIKSTLAAELAAVRRQLAELEKLAGEKASRALAGLPGAR
jgi:flagellar motor switch/type III secretory pathway protein FliN